MPDCKIVAHTAGNRCQVFYLSAIGIHIYMSGLVWQRCLDRDYWVLFQPSPKILLKKSTKLFGRPVLVNQNSKIPSQTLRVEV
jgi:hypothetical protein